MCRLRARLSDPAVGSSRRGLFLILSVKMRADVSGECARARRAYAGCEMGGADVVVAVGRGEDVMVM